MSTFPRPARLYLIHFRPNRESSSSLRTSARRNGFVSKVVQARPGLLRRRSGSAPLGARPYEIEPMSASCGGPPPSEEMSVEKEGRRRRQRLLKRMPKMPSVFRQTNMAKGGGVVSLRREFQVGNYDGCSNKALKEQKIDFCQR